LELELEELLKTLKAPEKELLKKMASMNSQKRVVEMAAMTVALTGRLKCFEMDMAKKDFLGLLAFCLKYHRPRLNVARSVTYHLKQMRRLRSK
jgi:hypothetical protein